MEKTFWICENCKYKFERAKGWHEDVCPYCGKKGFLRENSIQRFIDEVSEEE